MSEKPACSSASVCISVQYWLLTKACTPPPPHPPPCAQVIAGEVLHYLREAAPGDEVARADAVRSLCDLAERYAPDHAWFVETMNELFEVAGERSGWWGRLLGWSV